MLTHIEELEQWERDLIADTFIWIIAGEIIAYYRDRSEIFSKDYYGGYIEGRYKAAHFGCLGPVLRRNVAREIRRQRAMRRARKQAMRAA